MWGNKDVLREVGEAQLEIQKTRVAKEHRTWEQRIQQALATLRQSKSRPNTPAVIPEDPEAEARSWEDLMSQEEREEQELALARQQQMEA